MKITREGIVVASADVLDFLSTRRIFSISDLLRTEESDYPINTDHNRVISYRTKKQGAMPSNPWLAYQILNHQPLNLLELSIDRWNDHSAIALRSFDAIEGYCQSIRDEYGNHAQIKHLIHRHEGEAIPRIKKEIEVLRSLHRFV